MADRARDEAAPPTGGRTEREPADRDRADRDRADRDRAERDRAERDRDERGRPKNLRPRDELGRPLPRGEAGSYVEEALPEDPDELLALGVEHFNAGRYFQAHECWETAWHPAPAAERDFWQGITQVAVGFTHRQRGNPTGAVTLLRRGATRIEPYGPAFRGIPCGDLAAAARAAADAIERDGVEAGIQTPVLPPIRD